MTRVKLRSALAVTAVGLLAASCLPAADAGAAGAGQHRKAHRRTGIHAVLPRATTPTPAWTPYPAKPNILMITSDDLSIVDLPYMPHVEQLIGQAGVTFADAIAPTPMCVPARASLLTGQYATNDGAHTIAGPHGGWRSMSQDRTVPVALQRAGYDTLMVGKYVNGYGANPAYRTYVPPGWTDWRATIDPSTYNFSAPTLNVNGTLQTHHQYTTDVMSAQADQMLSSPTRTKRPWFMWLSYVAPHTGGTGHGGVGDEGGGYTVPAPQDAGKFAGAVPQRPDLFKHATGLPRHSPSTAIPTPAFKSYSLTSFRKRIEAVQSVDRAVASQIATLKRTGQLADTIVIFGSDNGYSTGEHNLNGKLWEYNEIERIPLLMRGPGIPVGVTDPTAITNPDIAATILQAAAAKPLRKLDGDSMLPWLTAPEQWRITPIAGWKVTNGNSRLYHGVRIGPWTYVRYWAGTEELYDRRHDPYELRNLSLLPKYAAQLAAMRRLSKHYTTCAGAGCPHAFYPASRAPRG
jgi:arylsulfatase A-like enzyme